MVINKSFVFQMLLSDLELHLVLLSIVHLNRSLQNRCLCSIDLVYRSTALVFSCSVPRPYIYSVCVLGLGLTLRTLIFLHTSFFRNDLYKTTNDNIINNDHSCDHFLSLVITIHNHCSTTSRFKVKLSKKLYTLYSIQLELTLLQEQ